jgi:uncharacterized membrane protein YfcA
MTSSYIYFLLLALLAEIAGTVSGFGSSVLFVPLAALFFDFKTVLALTAVFHVFSNIFKILLFRKGIDYNISTKLGIPSVLFVIAGAVLTVYLDVRVIEIGMDIMLIALTCLLFFSFNKSFTPLPSHLFAGGAISGFLAGICGTGGAIRGLTLSAFNLGKEQFTATSALIDFCVDASRTFIYIYNGFFDTQYLSLVPFLVAISFVGSYTGKHILKFIPEMIFRYIVLFTVLLTSVYQLSTLLMKS